MEKKNVRIPYLRDPMSLETKIKMSESKIGLIPKI